MGHFFFILYSRQNPTNHPKKSISITHASKFPARLKQTYFHISL